MFTFDGFYCLLLMGSNLRKEIAALSGQVELFKDQLRFANQLTGKLTQDLVETSEFVDLMPIKFSQLCSQYQKKVMVSNPIHRNILNT